MLLTGPFLRYEYSYEGFFFYNFWPVSICFNSQAIQKIEEENARLKGHQNPQQKVQHLLAIKRENHTLREVSNVLFFFFSVFSKVL